MNVIADYKDFVFGDTEPDKPEMEALLLRVMRGVNAQGFRMLGNRVLTGPFAGMIVPERTPHWDDGNSGVKLLGLYEHELHPVLEHAFWRCPRVAVNVGCAEGYYAVGFARFFEQGSTIFAFDIKAESLELCRDYAQLNKVRAELVLDIGCLSPRELRLPGAQGHRLYLIDCEGAEEELLDLQECPELVNSDIIVECHDFLRPNMSTELADRLSATHRVDLITPRLPDLDQFQFTRTSPTIMSVLMAVEKRPMPCYWLAAWANVRGH